MGATRLGMRGVVGAFYARLDAVTAGGWDAAISMMMDSDQASEEYKWLGQTPALRQWIGGREAASLLEKGIIINNETFEATLEMNVDELRRDKSGQLRVRINELADRTSEHWAKLLSDLIITPGNSYDGTGFFAVDHAEGDSGTQLNLLAAAQVPALDVVAAATPTDAEMNACIIGCLQYLLGYKDDRGEPMNANGRDFLIMVPTTLWGAAQAAVYNPQIAAGTGAKTNLLVNVGGGYNFSVVANPRLSSGVEFFIFRTDASARPFIRQEELLETGMEDQSFLNNRQLFGVKTNRNVGCGYWQYALQATLSTA